LEEVLAGAVPLTSSVLDTLLAQRDPENAARNILAFARQLT
jgi:hypothetical protein